MISPDLKDLFQSVESAFCVPEDTKQLSFAANLLKALQSDKVVSEIKLLSDRLDFSKCYMVLGDGDPGTICAFDVDIGFNKDHLEVMKRDPTYWVYSSLLNNERILQVIIVHSRSLRVVETKLRVYKEYEKLFRSKTLHLQHEYEDFDEIAKKSAYAKVSFFQKNIPSLVECISSTELAEIVSKAAEPFLWSQLKIREICCNELIRDGDIVGTASSSSYTCRSFLTVKRIKRMLVTKTLRILFESFGFEIWKKIMSHIKSVLETKYLYISKDQRQHYIEIPDTLFETISVETTCFLISICDPILFDAGSVLGTFVYTVDVNSIAWRGKVAKEIYRTISKHHKDIVKKTLILVQNMCKRTTEDLKNLDRSLEKWKEKIKCMDIIERKYGNKVKLFNFDKKLRRRRISESELGDTSRKYYEYWFMQLSFHLNSN